jgi:hypothetical protein
LLTIRLHRLNFYVALRKLIAELQAFSQCIQETPMVRFYSSIYSDDKMLITRLVTRDAVNHGDDFARRRAGSTIAASVASTATSASNGTHPPPACRAIATVSSAEERLLSTASTFAPLSAKRKTVARPLPKPSPGD